MVLSFSQYDLIVISGPTASYKSLIADMLYNACDSKIVNADSMQVYNALPILTAQPNDRNNTNKYALYSIFNYHELCSVGKWINLAHVEISKIRNQKKLPIIVGGTGLYINALLNGLIEVPDISEEIRERVRSKFREIGKIEFYKALCEREVSFGINPNDSQRMMRTMEVFEQTGKTLTSFKPYKVTEYDNVLHLCLFPDRALLYENCNTRFDAMLVNGVLDEVKALSLKIETDLENYSITKAIGFRELQDYLNNKISLDEARNSIKQFTRNYAKRQLTWFRNQISDKHIVKFNSTTELKGSTILGQLFGPWPII